MYVQPGPPDELVAGLGVEPDEVRVGPGGGDRFPAPLIHVLGRIKKAAAVANRELAVLDAERANLASGLSLIDFGRVDAGESAVHVVSTNVPRVRSCRRPPPLCIFPVLDDHRRERPVNRQIDRQALE